jgi:hypothetical protein
VVQAKAGQASLAEANKVDYADGVITLAKLLGELAVALLKRKKDDGVRQRLADLLCQVADCVSSIGDAVQNGALATERCLELDTYITHLHSLVAKETDDETASQLTFWLKHVEAVPSFARSDIGSRILAETKPTWSRGKRFQQAEEVRQIAGIIRAFGNLVRV